MSDENFDRRVQRTRQLLRSALVQLIEEKGYDAITIQDITERANLGRTTFYLHYESKEALLLDHTADLTAHFNLTTLGHDDLFSDTPQPEYVILLEMLAEHRPMYLAVHHSRDAGIIVRGLREQMTTNLQTSLKAIFPDTEPSMPLDMLTNYIIGAQIAFIDWWMMNRTAFDAAQIAAMLHRLQRAEVCHAYQVK